MLDEQVGGGDWLVPLDMSVRFMLDRHQDCRGAILVLTAAGFVLQSEQELVLDQSIYLRLSIDRRPFEAWGTLRGLCGRLPAEGHYYEIRVRRVRCPTALETTSDRPSQEPSEKAQELGARLSADAEQSEMDGGRACNP